MRRNSACWVKTPGQRGGGADSWWLCREPDLTLFWVLLESSSKPKAVLFPLETDSGLERLARELAARADGYVMVLHSAVHQSLIFNTSRHLDAPGAGQFTWQTDRARIASVIVQLIWQKLHYFLEQGDLHNYRFLLNTQMACCLEGLDAVPIEGLVPGFVAQSDPLDEPQAVTGVDLEYILNFYGS